jgi:hypothetical protein
MTKVRNVSQDQEEEAHIELTDSNEYSAPSSEDDEEHQEESENPISQKVHITPRWRLKWRQRIGLLIGIFPVVVFAFEAIPERCNVCMEGVTLDSYFFTAAICGGIGAVLYGDNSDYWHARMIGGSISALGSLFTIWMLLQSISSSLAFLFVFIGILGAMPGILAYYLVSILSDECYASRGDDWENEISPLTTPLVEPA